MRTRVFLMALLLPLSAHAQERTGFALDRFEPAERGSRFFVVDSLDLHAPAAGVVADYAHLPLVAYDAKENTPNAIVRHQLFVHAGGSFVLFGRVRFALDVPLAVYQDGEQATFAGARYRPATKPAFGDLRAAVDVRLVDKPFRLAAGVRAWAPTGVRSQHTGDGAARIGPQALASGEAANLSISDAHVAIVWAARVAVIQRWRDDTYAQSELGAEVTAAAGAGVEIQRRLFIGPEVFASSRLADFFGERATPVEAIAGAHYNVVDGLRIGALAGSGFGRGFGSPAFRVGLSVEWAPPIERSRPHPRDVEEEPMEFNFVPPPPPARPLAVMTETEIRIEQQVRFATDSAALLGDSDAVLAEVKRVLEEHPEVRKVRVEGHTDNVGDAAYNEDLSARRAAAVVTWLVTHGIASSRLESAGFGSRQPVDTNETETGRANNRRVVLRIIDRAP